MAARSRRALVFCALAVADGFQHLAARPARRVPTDRGSSRRIARAATPGDIAERLADSELVLEFDCFGFYNQDCLLTLGAGGGATFSAGAAPARRKSSRRPLGDASREAAAGPRIIIRA